MQPYGAVRRRPHGAVHLAGEDSPELGVTLAQGAKVSRTKAAPNVTQVLVGLGWDARSTTGAPFDLDASALLCGKGRVLGDDYFVFYNNLKSPEGSVEHTGDNLTGE